MSRVLETGREWAEHAGLRSGSTQRKGTDAPLMWSRCKAEGARISRLPFYRRTTEAVICGEA